MQSIRIMQNDNRICWNQSLKQTRWTVKSNTEFGSSCCVNQMMT